MRVDKGLGVRMEVDGWLGRGGISVNSGVSSGGGGGGGSGRGMLVFRSWREEREDRR